MNEVSSLIKETTESSLAPSPSEDGVRKQEVIPHQIPNLLAL